MENEFRDYEKKTKIRCEASNCIHHGECDECLAAEIKVGPRSACKCCDTECATFEEKPL